MIGKPLTLRNFTDSIMETKHRVKKGNFLFSGGKSGPIGKVEYQKQVLQQQFLSEYLRIETSSSYQTNVSRKLEYDPAEKHSVSNFPRELVLSLTVVSNTEKKNQSVVTPFQSFPRNSKILSESINLFFQLNTLQNGV